MPAITALLHARNDALRLGRALETLLPCDEILVIDHASQDATTRIAREYGAKVTASTGSSLSQYLQLVRHEWILCLEARESITEALSASLFEWKSQSQPGIAPFSLFLREETAGGWVQNPVPQTRLVPHTWNRWQGELPAPEPSAIALEGALLRFFQP
ncbi:MAG TPA: hypothetical protein VIW68_13410 [Candidatus Sulfotelmatobacter sp.]